MSLLLRGLAAVVLAMTSFVVFANVEIWDGKTYINLGMRVGSDSVLSFQEPVTMSAEEEGKFSIAGFGPASPSLVSYVVRPLVEQNQRVFFKGEKTGTIYVVRFSTSLRYREIVQVSLPAKPSAEPTKLTGTVTPTTPLVLMRSMMQRRAMAGFAINQSSRVIFDDVPFQLTAKEVWQGPTLTGVVVEITRTGPGDRAVIRPEALQIQIPELGSLRIFGSDSWEVVGSAKVRGYLVFSK